MRAAARDEAYALIWSQTAAELGIEVRRLPDGFFEFEGPGRPIRFQRGYPPVDETHVLDDAGDKPRHYRLLEEAGVTVPEYLEFRTGDPSKALEFLNRGGSDYVVKPALDTGAGIGVTSGVRTASDLHRAILRTSRAGDRILVERQASGSEYRVLVLDGVVIDIVCRHPPAVVGDGRSTIAQLIGAENRRRLEGDAFERLRMLTADLDCVLALRREGLGLGSHVAAGRRVVVKGVVNQNAPAENETLRAALPAALHTAAISAARATGLRLAGVDVVATGEADQAGGGVVLEVNPHPGLHHHYAVANRGGATRVATPILRM